MSAAARLQERPKPPSVDQIKSDIDLSEKDDIIFTLGTAGASRDSTPGASAESSFDSVNHMTNTEDGDHAADGKSQELPDIGSMYLKTLQLLNTTELLKSSPDALKDQYEQLEKLGKEVKEAIAELESAAQTVKPKAKPKRR